MVGHSADTVGLAPDIEPERVRGEVDFDLHGLVGIRLLDATPHDARIIERQVGPIQATLTREPDIIIRFVDRLTTTSPVRYLGVDETGFTEDAFLVLRAKHKTRARVQIPFEKIGRQVDITCERGVTAVPLLIPMVNLTVLSKGLLPMHASAFSYKGVGVLVTGWAKGGKTETLLAFMAQGAEYVGDEWIYLSPDGQRMYGIPEPIRIWHWHLNSLPQFRRAVRAGDRARLSGLNLLVQAMERASATGPGRFGFVRALRSMTVALRRQLYVHLPPRQLFGDQVGSLAGSPQKVFFLASHEAPDVTMRAIDPREIADRMVFSLQQERADFLMYYVQFCFAFPERRNGLIDQAQDTERRLLHRILAGKECRAVYHPYPVALSALFELINPSLS